MTPRVGVRTEPVKLKERKRQIKRKQEDSQKVEWILWNGGNSPSLDVSEK